jgi:hypothetical protein
MDNTYLETIIEFMTPDLGGSNLIPDLVDNASRK